MLAFTLNFPTFKYIYGRVPHWVENDPKGKGSPFKVLGERGNR